MSRQSCVRIVASVVMTGFLFTLGSARAEEEPAKDVWRLSLADALRTALEHNLDLVIVKRDPKIAELGIDIQDAVFDPLLGASASQLKSKQEAGSSFDITDQETTSAGASWVDKLKFGGEYSVGFGSSRSKLAGPLILVPSSYGSGVTLTYKMPLLRGLGTEVTTELVILAQASLDISRQSLRTQAQSTLKETEDAYWNLHAARGGLSVARQSLDLAHDLYDLNKKKVDVGTLAPIEITQAEAGVASREEGVIVAETGLENAEDSLRRLLAIPKDDPAWSKTIEPTDAPKFDPISPDLDSSITEALAERPELISARHDLRSKELNERVAKSNRKPQLDLDARYGPSGNNFAPAPGPDGLFGTPDDTSLVSGGLSESISEVGDLTNYEWAVGLTFSWAVGNRAAKANYAIATLNREKSDLSLQNLEQSIRVDVRTAVRNVLSGAKRVAAARSATVLQKKTLDAEQKKFENGMSTSFEVLRIQTDLANAQLAEITAIVDYNKSLADLERAKGTLIEAKGLKLDESVGD